MARIDAPQLDELYILISFSEFYEIIVLHTPHIIEFIGLIPKLQTPIVAYIGFEADIFKIWVNFISSTRISGRASLRLEIFCIDPERQFPCLAQFCRSLPSLLHSLEYLCIDEGQFSQKGQQNHTENTHWLELLQPFVAVKKLYLSEEFAVYIAHALQELGGERVMEVLPDLENVFIAELQPSGPLDEVIKEFVAARQLTSHPITISRWDRKERRAIH